MELHVVINGRKDLAGQLYNQLRSAIESGRLTAGTQLPPSRLLAEQLGISRKTISDTYAQLTYENFLTGVVGKGTYVNARSSKVQRKRSHTELGGFEVIESWRNLPVFLRHPTLEGSLRYDFIGGATSKGQFPRMTGGAAPLTHCARLPAPRACTACPRACRRCVTPLRSTLRSPAGSIVRMRMWWCATARSRRWT